MFVEVFSVLPLFAVRNILISVPFFSSHLLSIPPFFIQFWPAPLFAFPFRAISAPFFFSFPSRSFFPALFLSLSWESRLCHSLPTDLINICDEIDSNTLNTYVYIYVCLSLQIIDDAILVVHGGIFHTQDALLSELNAINRAEFSLRDMPDGGEKLDQIPRYVCTVRTAFIMCEKLCGAGRVYGGRRKAALRMAWGKWWL